MLRELLRLGRARAHDVELGGAAWASFRDWLADESLSDEVLNEWVATQPPMGAATLAKLREVLAAELARTEQ